MSWVVVRLLALVIVPTVACDSPSVFPPTLMPELPCSDIRFLKYEERGRLYAGRRGECTDASLCHGPQIGCYSTDPDAKVPERGWVASYYPNGTMRSLGRIVRGELHGAWIEYSPDGVVISQGEYDDGQAVGHWRFRDSKGVLQDAFFKDGRMLPWQT